MCYNLWHTKKTLEKKKYIKQLWFYTDRQAGKNTAPNPARKLFFYSYKFSKKIKKEEKKLSVWCRYIIIYFGIWLEIFYNVKYGILCHKLKSSLLVLTSSDTYSWHSITSIIKRKYCWWYFLAATDINAKHLAVCYVFLKMHLGESKYFIAQ